MRGLVIAAVSIFIWSLAGCKANPPGKLETNVVNFAKHHVFIGNKKMKNPLPDNPETLADGKEAFSHYCVACHGMDGQSYWGSVCRSYLASDPVARFNERAELHRRPTEMGPRQRHLAIRHAWLKGNAK